MQNVWPNFDKFANQIIQTLSKIWPEDGQRLEKMLLHNFWSTCSRNDSNIRKNFEACSGVGHCFSPVGRFEKALFVVSRLDSKDAEAYFQVCSVYRSVQSEAA